MIQTVTSLYYRVTLTSELARIHGVFVKIHLTEMATITTVGQTKRSTERTTRKLLNQEAGDANAKRGNRAGVMSFGPDPGFRGV